MSEGSELLQLSESERRFHATFEQAAVGIAHFAMDGRWLLVNQRFCEIVGYPREELLHLTTRDLTHPDELDSDRLIFQRMLGGEMETFSREKRYLRKNGDIAWIHLTLSLVRKSDQSPDYFISVIEDITRRKAVEHNLKQALSDLDREHRLLKSLIQTLPDLIWLKDTKGVYLACNPAFERFFGTTEEEIVGKKDDDFVSTELTDFFREHARIDSPGLEPSTNVGWITFASDGRKVLLEMTRTLTVDSRGKVIGVLSIGRDITERQQAEQAVLESSQLYDAVLASTKDGFLLVDPMGQLVEVNDAYCHYSGYCREELLNMSLPELDTNVSHAQINRLIEKISLEGAIILESSHRRKDGSAWPVEISLSYSPVQGGRYFYFLRDISERKEEEQLDTLRQQLGEMVYEEDQQRLLRTALDTAEKMTQSEIGFFHFVDKDQETVSLQTWSTRTLKEMCYAKDGGLHYPVKEAGVWVDCIHQRKAVIHNDYASLPHKKGLPDGHAPVIRELTVPVFRDDHICAVIGVGNKAVNYNDHDLGIVTRIANITYDFIERKQAEQQIQFMAYNDVLTGLPNRQLFADRLHQAISLTRRSDRLLAICYLDLDGFKPINDRYGHNAGDNLLVQLARRLTEELREGDTLARLGGDEFVILLSGLHTIYNGEEIVQRLLGAIAQPFEVDNYRVHVSASIGVTFFPQDDADPDTLLRHADQAMYKAKENGKNTYRLYDPIQNQKVHAHRKAIKEFEQALAQQQLRLYFQPRIELRTGKLSGVEALVRWQHPEQGLLAPGEFLPLIENSPLEIALDEWVLQETLNQHIGWREQGLILPVSVNISPRHIQQRTFPDYLGKLLSRYPEGIARHLELEVLETTAIGDTNRVAEIMNACADLGVNFSLDDFGTGYSSLTYFHRLPVNILKIDQNFVRNMLSDPGDQDIVEGVLRLADALNRPVVAEGVESIELGLMLLQLGCHYAQGYGIAKPMPAQAILDWSSEWETNSFWRELQKISEGLTDNYDLDVAIFTHRYWLENVKKYLQSGLATERPNLDGNSCQFTRWYMGIGSARYGMRPQFAFILAKHSAVHDLANKLVALAEQQALDKALAGLDELNALGEELIGMLRRLAKK